MAKYSKAASKKVGEVMREFSKGDLKMGKKGPGKGPKVKSRKQALAIGLSEARQRGMKVPRMRGK